MEECDSNIDNAQYEPQSQKQEYYDSSVPSSPVKPLPTNYRITADEHSLTVAEVGQHTAENKQIIAKNFQQKVRLERLNQALTATLQMVHLDSSHVQESQHLANSVQNKEQELVDAKNEAREVRTAQKEAEELGIQHDTPFLPLIAWRQEKIWLHTRFHVELHPAPIISTTANLCVALLRSMYTKKSNIVESTSHKSQAKRPAQVFVQGLFHTQILNINTCTTVQDVKNELRRQN
ncbi:hypothetical protein BDP27DRAFT_1368635 [Rhodocollybia butyracea]|uniref:Uncharacterized protein n=1 Tax=Rhodocollybia butyracea TaxID=206335 RepID=A0A9P5PGA4_9AGAR|nr:hypothetical protein BDP27DRAFT_1368635 [Rhodocollybia butyracea]